MDLHEEAMDLEDGAMDMVEVAGQTGVIMDGAMAMLEGVEDIILLIMPPSKTGFPSCQVRSNLIIS